MRRRLASAFVLIAALPAFAQTPPDTNPLTGARPDNEIGIAASVPLSDQPGNITQGDTTSLIAGHLPDPSAGEDSSVLGYLLSARGALAAGRDGEAQEALERAESRALDRSVPLFRTADPSRSPLVARIHQVLLTLGNGDRMGAMRALEDAIAAAGP